MFNSTYAILLVSLVVVVFLNYLSRHLFFMFLITILSLLLVANDINQGQYGLSFIWLFLAAWNLRNIVIFRNISKVVDKEIEAILRDDKNIRS